MMLTLQMLPAGCGDCLWLEYGTGAAKRVVIIDGGLTETATALRQRIEKARQERGVATLDVELLVVTHIDNDHILGIIDLLKAETPGLRVKDIWFNGRPQLVGLPNPPRSGGRSGGRGPRKSTSTGPADLMGGAGDSDEVEGEDQADLDVAALPSAADLLGPQQGDQLSKLLAARNLPWNKHALWKGGAVMIPDSGDLPSVTLEGDLKLTVLGPSVERLYRLCTAWADVLGGRDEPATAQAVPDDLLGRRDTWPPVWKDGEGRDPSVANGSSIMLLAEYGSHALLLAGDGYAPDLAAAFDRLRAQRQMPGAFPLDAFKLSHHASENNLTRELLEKIDCRRFLVSTDGSVHRHPDHQALLRILRYVTKRPELLFNYSVDTTRPWDEKKSAVTKKFQDYDTRFPTTSAEGMILSVD
jgi:Metallo-beta-lactamase superfamily